MTVVLDASVTIRWLLSDGSSQDLAYADAVLGAVIERGSVVPVIWALEVANVAARAEANSLIRPELTTRFLERLEAMPIKVDEEMYERAFTDTLALARSHKLTAYDASYLELARRLDIPLATLDEDLQKAAKKAGVKKFS